MILLRSLRVWIVDVALIRILPGRIRMLFLLLRYLPLRGIGIAGMIIVIISIGLVFSIFVLIGIPSVIDVLLLMPRVWMIATHDAILNLFMNQKLPIQTQLLARQAIWNHDQELNTRESTFSDGIWNVRSSSALEMLEWRVANSESILILNWSANFF